MTSPAHGGSQNMPRKGYFNVSAEGSLQLHFFLLI